MASKRELLPGTLDMLILGALSGQSMHGYGIAQHIRRRSRDVLKVEEGSLYPALQRMRQNGTSASSRLVSPSSSTPSRA